MATKQSPVIIPEAMKAKKRATVINKSNARNRQIAVNKFVRNILRQELINIRDAIIKEYMRGQCAFHYFAPDCIPGAKEVLFDKIYAKLFHKGYQVERNNEYLLILWD